MFVEKLEREREEIAGEAKRHGEGVAGVGIGVCFVTCASP